MPDDEFNSYDPKRSYSDDAASQMKKKSNRRFVIALGVGFVVLCTLGIIVGKTSPNGGQDLPSASATQSSESPTPDRSPEPTPWAEAPRKGKWAEGKLGGGRYGDDDDDTQYGEWHGNSEFLDHRLKITGPPEFTTTDPAEAITVRSPVLFERVGDKWPERTIRSDFYVSFRYERQSDRGSYSEGSHEALIDCGDDAGEPLERGETLSCYIVFTALPEEVPNFHWAVNRRLVAAWPGQSA